ncbi:ATP-binding cassette domain-containing protein [Peptoniphilus sp. KCTC 25270]|uniref:ABC transporter ATP-binding protein n=1 Tax=Peptoniphilus sp. KCTC 25270 TaxID=2897414 RepID=UPI001E47E352|nr:ATP-binding cassette domain-containing protein [Peptoniphilus sp. KCTC 25270]MCD1147650.1 ATP-binding cassette domain-containing protein [Peptoniphilus sp. KCTC 25270]
MNGITLKNVSKIYSIAGKPFRAVSDLTLNLNREERTILIGESGCGKSTLLKLISGLEEQTEGEILFHEIDPSMVFQNPRLFPWKNVRENIEFSLKDEVEKEEVDKWIKMVKLSGFETAYPSQLSGGMQSRVSLARAMVANKNYLLMDEPFAALDGFTRSEMQKQLLEIVDVTKRGFLFVTHSIDEAFLLGERIIIMKKGEILSDFYLKDQSLTEEELKEYFLHLIKGEKNEETI